MKDLDGWAGSLLRFVALELLTQGDDDAVERPDVLLLLVGSIVLAVNTKAPHHK